MSAMHEELHRLVDELDEDQLPEAAAVLRRLAGLPDRLRSRPSWTGALGADADLTEMMPARRRTGADLRAALRDIPPPDDRFAENVVGALALLSGEVNDRGPTPDPRFQRALSR